MFGKILIANRGEIACRIIKTAKKMGIATVAVYSEADKNAMHVSMADEAIHIGPAPASESYLLIDRIVAACKASGAEAVHPGYGFLSEREAFAQALAGAGITFIGPNASAIAAMGDKIESKKRASAAKVSTVPGFLGVISDERHAVKIADGIGYPVMIKASAGGGGKGMRVAHSSAEVSDGFQRAKSEAKSSFGDDRVFIEKFIVDPRHIEIQLLGDKHGNVVYLHERECSVQRRNQKVLEEAPSPLLDAETRKAMGEQAVSLAKAVNYDSAGTVEFVAGQDKSFFFLEMNTRLQVEHPVTEMITGIDLVEEMIRVAAGEKLRFKQSDIQLNGWAVESRVYAEDPTRNFLPSIGRLVKFQPPEVSRSGNSEVRVDTDVYEGDEISIHYDPMIAKLVTHGPTRLAAIESHSMALDAFAIEGIRHNIPFLASLMGQDRWRSGKLSTSYIKDEFPEGFAIQAPDGVKALTVTAIALDMASKLEGRKKQITGQMARETKPSGDCRNAVCFGAQKIEASVRGAGEGISVKFEKQDDAQSPVLVKSAWQPGDAVWHGTVNGAQVAAHVRASGVGHLIVQGGTGAVYTVMSPRQAALSAHMLAKADAGAGNLLLCPMPGVVRSIMVAAGQSVKAGEPLAVVEAMKMENVLRAEHDVTIKTVKVSAGDSLAVDAVILEFA